MPQDRLERFASRAVPVYLAVLFAAQVLFGWLLEYTPAGDNFMLFNGSKMLALEGSFANYPDFGLYLARFSNQWGFLLMMTGALSSWLSWALRSFSWPLSSSLPRCIRLALPLFCPWQSASAAFAVRL